MNDTKTIARRPSVVAQERKEYYVQLAAVAVGVVVVGMTLALLSWSLML